MILIGGCSNDPSGIDGEWELVSGTLDGAAILPPDQSSPGDMGGSDRPVLLVVESGQASGRGPCNRYDAPIRITAPTGQPATAFEFQVEFGEGSAELMGCSESENETERKYLPALVSSNHGERTGDTLILTGDGVRLEFKRAKTG